jgi:hypothetical protein
MPANGGLCLVSDLLIVVVIVVVQVMQIVEGRHLLFTDRPSFLQQVVCAS